MLFKAFITDVTVKPEDAVSSGTHSTAGSRFTPTAITQPKKIILAKNLAPAVMISMKISARLISPIKLTFFQGDISLVTVVNKEHV